MHSMIDWILDVYKAEDIKVEEASSDAYSYLEPGECVAIFRNPLNEECNLYVFFLKHRYTLVFGNWSRHFERNLKDEKSLIYALELILNQQAHVLSICSNTYIMCCLCYKNRLFFSSDASERLITAMTNHEFLESAINGELTITKLFWEEPSQNIQP